ncbi:MAG: hypothetical protein NWR72_21250 [Bacteroidia bacterium]|nr:hypothetical protein [Bacteroidia bacterium]
MKRFFFGFKPLFFAPFILWCSLAGAQTSPVQPGQTRDQIRREQAGRSAHGFTLEEVNSNRWLLTHQDSSGYQARISVNFDEDRANKVLAEWTGLDSTYRFVMYRWFEATQEALSQNGDFQRDTNMEDMLNKSYPGKRAKTAVFVAKDFSHRQVIVFYATEKGAFFSHMQQVYFWEE